MTTSRISESAFLAPQMLAHFKEMMANLSKVEALSPAQLIEAVQSYADTHRVHTYEYVLLTELISRYEDAVGIDRSEDWPEPTDADIEAQVGADKDKVLYWVIQHGDGEFNALRWGKTPSLSQATHFLTREEAELMAGQLTDVVVVEVTS